MNESLQDTRSQPASIAAEGVAMWLARGKSSANTIVHGVLKARRSLPLYCSPPIIFVINWALMLVSLRAQVTYVTYPSLGIPIVLCCLSMGSFFPGYLVSRALFHHLPGDDRPVLYTLDVTRLWNLNLLLCCIALLIVTFNWITLGPPPALGDPTSYLTYGRFKQILFPVLVSIVVNATLDPSRRRVALSALFGIAGLGLYISRGLLMVALLQVFFVFSLRTSMSRRRLHAIVFGFLIFAVAAVTVIGNIRTSQGVFLEYLQIRQRYFGWPTAYLWVTSYISIPFSNLCWFFREGFHAPTLAFLYPFLPSFLMPAYPHAAIGQDLRVIDGASTYLAGYALDFSYLGVYLANLALGFGCGWFVERLIPRMVLTAAILLTCLSFIFFSDMFVPLSTIIQLIIQGAVMKRCLRFVDDQNGQVPTQ